MKRKSVGTETESENSMSPAKGRRRVNGRACTHCHRLKIRCDILEKGPPCTGCSSRNRPGCHIYPKKQRRGATAARLLAPVPIRPRESTPLELATDSSSSLEVDTVHSSVRNEDGEEHEASNLADFLGRHDMREAEFGRLTRVCFIGTGMSNCHYLVRQNLPRAGHESSVHLGYSQMRLKGTSYYRTFVPPEILERPDKDIAERLLRAYFDYVNCGWPIVDEEEFMIQYEGKDPDNPMSAALLNAIFLVGAHVLSSQDESMHSLRPIFFRRAKTLIDYRFESDRLVYVQVSLLMTWHSDGFEEVAGSAWHWIGISARTAMAFGMHRDATRSRMLPVHKRVNTRLWWILFQFDTISALSSGRPQAINLDDSDVPDLEYSHFEGVPNAQKDFVIYQTKLCVIISRAIREGWSLRSSLEDRVRATRKADESLAEFILQLPLKVQLKFSTLDTWQSMLHLTYNNFVILLHRPPPKQSTAEEVLPDQCNDPVLCGDSATMIAAIFETLPPDVFSTLWLYSTNVLITATIHIIHEAGSTKPIVAARSLHILEILMMALRGLSKYWHYARAWLHFVEQRALKLKQQRSAKAQVASGQQDEENGQAGAPFTGPEEVTSSRGDENRCEVEESFLDAITNGAIGSTPEGGLCIDGADVSLPDDLFLFDAFTLDLFPDGWQGDTS
ncbi:hypothetical protein N0V84_010790 [Fusarium piperis]|uniref:Zn(2)-C6 fungal-type domain-containing protein n=1 Tax=Fusarium piperis TaxID=1435070 RepID=A0A9W8TF21_9HYPO|nr:hypothetical protein N0V84_010790 [Fusarium piperis]